MKFFLPILLLKTWSKSCLNLLPSGTHFVFFANGFLSTVQSASQFGQPLKMALGKSSGYSERNPAILQPMKKWCFHGKRDRLLFWRELTCCEIICFLISFFSWALAFFCFFFCLRLHCCSLLSRYNRVWVVNKKSGKAKLRSGRRCQHHHRMAQEVMARGQLR